MTRIEVELTSNLKGTLEIYFAYGFQPDLVCWGRVLELLPVGRGARGTGGASIISASCSELREAASGGMKEMSGIDGVPVGCVGKLR
jgi:hypothetical protein